MKKVNVSDKMLFMASNNFDLSKLLQTNPNLSRKQKLKFVWTLSIPGIFAQISSIIMQYIDAAMVGSLGANASASIGLVASSTWVLGSLVNSLSVGFTVQVAHAVGEGNQDKAKRILLKSIASCIVFSVILGIVAVSISDVLPKILGGEQAILKDSSIYFLVFAASTPLYQMIYLMSGMLQCSGNMKIPSILNSAMCILDAIFNVLFIKVLKLGVMGAAFGTAASALVIAILMIYFTLVRSEYLGISSGRKPLKFSPTMSQDEDESQIVKTAIKLAFPIAVESVAFTGVLVVITRIIAPLGAIALSANSFAVTAEALCYMPGYGISEAATTLVGQSVGAKRKDLVNSFSWIAVISGMAIMAAMGIVMFLICPYVFKILTPVQEIQTLAIKVLRIELFAEPFYGAAIVATGALRGQNDTFIPSILNLISLWIVRLGLSLLLVGKLGVLGIWIAMTAELCFRGIVMLARLVWKSRQ